MKETTVVRLGSDEAPGARQRSLVMRERWEESWLAQQRDVTGVIRQPAISPAAPAELPDREPAHALDGSARAPAVASVMAAQTNSHELDANRARSEDQRTLGGVRPLSSAASAFGVAHSSRPREAMQRVTAAQGERVASDAPATLRNSAFWRREGAVEGTMRLRDPQRSAHSILAQLRHWIRESGASLRRLVINGRVAWHAESAPQAAQQRQPSTPSNRDTYI